MTHHPAKPNLTLRVGITGHRPNKLNPAAAARITEQLRQVFAAIDEAAQAIWKTNQPFYSAEPPRIRLISGFAEGTDQIAVAVSPESWQIEALLPFPHDEYLNDFKQSAAGDGRDVRQEFEQSLKRAAVVTELVPPPSGERNRAYAQAGGFMLRQIDVLIAAWNGEPPETGGTGALVREAWEGGIPVVWLSTAGALAPRLIGAFDKHGPKASAEDCTEGSLQKQLSQIFDAPAIAANARAPSARQRLDDFLSERWREGSYWFIYDLLRQMVRSKAPRFFIPAQPLAERREEWNAFLAAAPPTGNPRKPADRGNLQSKLKGVLIERYAWADALAVHYGHAHRSAYIVAYLLSAAAVLCAVIAVVLHGNLVLHPVVAHPGPSDAVEAPGNEIFLIAEFTVIVLILLIVWFGRRRRWHARWLDYRTLAENLRHARSLAFVGAFGSIHEAQRGPGGREPPWTLWYIRATLREIGLPTAVLDDDYQVDILKATLEHEITGNGGQIHWHEGNQKDMGRIDAILHVTANACFILVSAVLLLLVCRGLFEWIRDTVPPMAHTHLVEFLANLAAFLRRYEILFAAFLPAFGAALAGIRVQGEFEGGKERSEHMVDELVGLTRDYESATVPPVDLDETYALLVETAGVMSQDVAAWQELYGRKPLSLPA